MNKARVLIIDDEQAMLENCCRLLTREGYECHTLVDPTLFRPSMTEVQPEVLLLDLRMPGADGMSVLAEALAADPSLPVIIMTAYATVGSAVQAIREGAFDYIGKPFTRDQLSVAVARAVKYRGLTEDNRALRAHVTRASPLMSLVGSSPAMARLLNDIEKVGPTDADVLITGESGTGKELVARSVHAYSPRSRKPFIPVDCAAIPEALLESELFGHEKGSFTGAVARKTGLLAKASGGTIFLDEVGELPVSLQSKLLRALEERQVRRVGSTSFENVDIRVVAATNMNLEAASAGGSFRQDLYYRLNVVHLKIPPLRERHGDVQLLTETFLAEFAELQGVPAPCPTPDAWDALARHPWPGNVREVRNLAHRLIVFDDDGTITLADLPDSIRGWSGPIEGHDEGPALPYAEAREEALSAFRTTYCRRLLAENEGNITRAAAAAGVSRRTFHRWLAEQTTDGEKELGSP
jgi:DNA-binding NtrC family response regulator